MLFNRPWNGLRVPLETESTIFELWFHMPKSPEVNEWDKRCRWMSANDIIVFYWHFWNQTPTLAHFSQHLFIFFIIFRTFLLEWHKNRKKNPMKNYTFSQTLTIHTNSYGFHFNNTHSFSVSFSLILFLFPQFNIYYGTKCRLQFTVERHKTTIHLFCAKRLGMATNWNWIPVNT